MIDAESGLSRARRDLWPFEAEGRQLLVLRLTGPVLTLSLIVALDTIARVSTPLPNPGALLTLTVIVAAFLGGVPSAAVSASLALGYALSVLADAQGLPNPGLRDPRVGAVILVIPGSAVLVLYLRHLAMRTIASARSFERAAAAATAQLDAERDRLAASEERFRAIFHASPVALLLADANDGTIIDINPAMCRLIRVTREEAVGRTVDALGDVTPPMSEGEVTRLAATGSLVREATFARLGAEPVRLRADLVRIDIGGRPVLLGASVDLSDRDRAEALQAVAAASHSELDRQREEFLSLLAHELRTPVASIELLARSINDAGVPDAIRERASVLSVEARRLRGLAEDLLTIGRIEAGILGSRRSACDLREVVRRALEHLKAPRLLVRLAGAPVAVEADADQVGQIVDNLVSNAMKYSHQSEAVVVEVTIVDGRATVRVIDGGIGLDPADIGSLFRKYGRIQRDGSPSAPGAGLGLYLARRLAEANGGVIDAWSAGLGRGSTFTLSLPSVA